MDKYVDSLRVQVLGYMSSYFRIYELIFQDIWILSGFRSQDIWAHISGYMDSIRVQVSGHMSLYFRINGFYLGLGLRIYELIFQNIWILSGFRSQDIWILSRFRSLDIWVHISGYMSSYFRIYELIFQDIWILSGFRSLDIWVHISGYMDSLRV